MATIQVQVPAGVDSFAAKRMLEQVLEHHARIRRVTDALAREAAPLGPGALAQVGRVDRAWRDVGAKYGLYSAGEVARLTGAAPRSVRSHVHNLRRRNGLLAVRRGGALVYPGFQLTSGTVRTVRSDWRDLTTPLLSAGWAEAEVLLWFASPTGLLSGDAPADILEQDAQRVRDAVGQASAGTPG